MTCRHMYITLLENGDVEYRYFRHYSRYKLHRYLIEYPAERVIIQACPDVETDNFRRTVTADGFLLLLWDKVEEGSCGPRGELRYTKVGLMQVLQESPRLLHYQEAIRIKAESSSSEDFGTFELCLHGPNRRVSAVKSRSTAVFRTDSGRATSVRTRPPPSRSRSGLLAAVEPALEKTGSEIHLTPYQLSEIVFEGSGTLAVDWVLEIDAQRPL